MGSIWRALFMYPRLFSPTISPHWKKKVVDFLFSHLHRVLQDWRVLNNMPNACRAKLLELLVSCHVSSFEDSTMMDSSEWHNADEIMMNDILL